MTTIDREFYFQISQDSVDSFYVKYIIEIEDESDGCSEYSRNFKTAMFKNIEIYWNNQKVNKLVMMINPDLYQEIVDAVKDDFNKVDINE